MVGVLRADLVAPAVLVGEVDLAPQGVEQVELAVDDVEPAGRGRILEVGHPYPGTGVESIDGHLARGGPGDLAPPVRETGGGRRHLPGPVGPDLGGLGQEVERRPRRPDRVAVRPGLQQLGPARAELSGQLGHEVERVGGQDLVEPRQHLGLDRDGRRSGTTGWDGEGHAPKPSEAAVGQDDPVNFTVRQLTAEDAEAAWQLGFEAFGVPSPRPAGHPRPARPGLLRRLRRRRLGRQMIDRAYDSYFGGALVPTCGIAAVTVAAEYRGQGALRRCSPRPCDSPWSAAR